jgi:uncharacterized protein YukE
MAGFTHNLIMDVDATQETLSVIRTHREAMDVALAEIFNEVENGLRQSWQGPSAYEFFILYDRVYDRMEGNILALKDLQTKFQEEIIDWLEMSGTLAP